MNQSQLEENTCSRRQARENACEKVTIGFGFNSDWLRTRREYFFNQSHLIENCSTSNKFLVIGKKIAALS